jgi:glycosyltransferase involved in cell wall biosynthesis
MRAWDHLRQRVDDFDIVHDNQTLGYGLLLIERMGLPVLATIHHPITVDRRLEMSHAPTWWKRMSLGRWYGFTKMQTRVAKRLRRVVTVSGNSFKDIVADHQVDPERMAIVPVGVDPDVFRPLDDVDRVPGRLVTTASADVTMKGLKYLLEALAKLRTERDDVHLVVIGKEKPGGSSSQVIDALGLREHVEFVTGVSERRIIELYSEAQLAVVPSLYEGFSLPAIEAMACGCPLVATTGGAIPEVVGEDGETAMLVPPGDSEALATRIRTGLDDPESARRIGLAGRDRVVSNWSWRHTAERTVEQYRILLGTNAESTPGDAR